MMLCQLAIHTTPIRTVSVERSKVIPVKQREEDRTNEILSILSKGPWCIEVLAAAARHGSCSKADLMHVLKQAGAKGPIKGNSETPLTGQILDRCLSILRIAKLIEQAGERVAPTPLGVTTAARLNPEKRALFIPTPTIARMTTREERSTLRPFLWITQTLSKAATILPVAHRVTSERESEIRSSGRGSRFPMKDAVNAPGFDVSNPSARENGSVPAQADPASEVHSEDQRRKSKYAKLLVPIVAILVVIGWNYVGAYNTDSGARYRFAEVRRGDFRISTISTGRIKAVDSVEVSSQLSGQVIKLYADFNSKVTAGAPLAKLDDKTFKASVAEAKARLSHAKASYDAAAARIIGTEARYTAAKTDYRRKETLKKHGGISTQQLDKAQADMATAESDLNAARADEEVQAASVAEAKATLNKAQINLDRTIIRSPITGTVIKRSVELGQTVAVSMKAPTLFTIAHNLTDMRVHARVDEADIGRIHVDQHVEFSVDAYPNRTFTGRVISIRHAPEIVQNVVTYTVVITAENRDLALLPGMTAIVHIVTTEQPRALMVPDAALRFRPGAAESSRQPEGAGKQAGNNAAEVWVRTSSGTLHRAKINIGKSNGSMTEVMSGSLSKGELVAVGKQLPRQKRTLFGIHLGF